MVPALATASDARAAAAPGPCRRPGPRRCAAAARRTPPRGSGRRACPARCRAGAARARRRCSVRRKRAWSSSTATPSSPALAAMATTCCASTSSGLRGTTVVSMSPSRMRRATTAHSSRSARNLGKMRPRDTSPTPCPARPMRCSPRVTDLGDSTWITRSTAPMSMPSSSDDVATRHGRSPDLSWSSMTTRSSRASDPWWARAISRGLSPAASASWAARSLSRRAMRSAARRLLTNTSVERCSRTSCRSSG